MTDGARVVIYNPANGKALSTTYNGYYNLGTDVTMSEGTLSGFTAAEVWTVGVNADGTYTLRPLMARNCLWEQATPVRLSMM